MIGAVICLVLGLFCWAMTIICLNVDWVMISGVNMLPKDERLKFKEKHDMRAMNKYIGKRMFLPSAIFCSIFTPIIFFEPAWVQSTWAGVVIFFACIVFIVYIISAVPKILGNKFEKDKHD